MPIILILILLFLAFIIMKYFHTCVEECSSGNKKDEFFTIGDDTKCRSSALICPDGYYCPGLSVYNIGVNSIDDLHNISLNTSVSSWGIFSQDIIDNKPIKKSDGDFPYVSFSPKQYLFNSNYINIPCKTNGFSIIIYAQFLSDSSITPPNYERIFDFGDKDNYNNLIFCRIGTTTNAGFINFNDNNSNYIQGGIIDTKWNIWAITYNNKTDDVKLFQNGNLVAINNFLIKDKIENLNNNYIGKSNLSLDLNANLSLNANIAGIYIYNFTLTDDIFSKLNMNNISNLPQIIECPTGYLCPIGSIHPVKTIESIFNEMVGKYFYILRGYNKKLDIKSDLISTKSANNAGVLFTIQNNNPIYIWKINLITYTETDTKIFRFYYGDYIIGYDSVKYYTHFMESIDQPNESSYTDFDFYDKNIYNNIYIFKSISSESYISVILSKN